MGVLALLTLCEVGSIALVNSPLRTPFADTVSTEVRGRFDSHRRRPHPGRGSL